MEAKAIARYVRISPSKVKIVLDLIKNKPLNEAYAILKFTPKRGSEVVYKVLKSAAANAENNFEMDPSKLYVKNCFANEGPTMKRVRPRAQGRAFRISKRTSHITIILDQAEEV